MTLAALDLFAGAGGWDIAAHALGIDVQGVELMPEALETREANGLATAYRDVWDGLLGNLDPEQQTTLWDWQTAERSLLISSPPCQGYSMAGRGEARRAGDDVLDLLYHDAYRDPEMLRERTEGSHDSTALVLTPLAYAWRDRPMFIAWEQVPAVQPVWDLCAGILRSIGYSVWTGKLHAEQYGVPQTRIRSVLIARRDGVEATQPTPTHSRYYQRDPERMDPGVLPWISMAQALGWGFTERPMLTVTGHGRMTRQATGTKQALVTADEAGTFAFRPPFTPETARKPGPQREDYISLSDRYHPEAVNFTPDEARVLQTFPSPDLDALAAIVRENVNDQSGTPYDATWPAKRPALTVAGRGLVPHPGATSNRYNDSTKSRNDGIKITPAQAAALQAFPPEYVLTGSEQRKYLQVGNAVPPLLAMAILRTFL